MQLTVAGHARGIGLEETPAKEMEKRGGLPDPLPPFPTGVMVANVETCLCLGSEMRGLGPWI